MELTKRVDALEQRMAALETQAIIPGEPLRLIQPSVPENWHRREFNGGYNYVLPLRNDDNRTVGARSNGESD